MARQPIRMRLRPEEFFFKPIATSTIERTDSPDVTDNDAPPTATEQRREVDAGTRTQDQATARGLSRRPVGRTGGRKAHRPTTFWEERGLDRYDPKTERGEGEP
ncbi:hypothetical protein NDU88_001036 [Pleurodeles waltl]|uniref:Uncharacterized protein n=1 Tax=Pleurodeles waltl TaxID=8319 RepID=A0AAV7MLI4_PLEWA|nr:hypothetical protein NDU88_001036 [Pleurodeles waltl]